MPTYEPEVLVMEREMSVDILTEQVNRENQRISDAFHTRNDLEADRVPGKVQEGMLRFFDPAIYAPGLVKGLYLYQDGEWKYVGPLPDTLPGELWETATHGLLTLAVRNIVPAFLAVIPGSTAQAFTVDGAGIMTAQARFACEIAMSCLFSVVLNANNQDINWSVFDTPVGATVILPPIGEFASSARVVTFQKTSTSTGSALFDVGDTIQFQSQILSLTGITPTVSLDRFLVDFNSIQIIP